MDFYAVLDAVLELLQRHKRVTYRALKRQFGLDDAYLEDLKAEIIEARQLAVDQDGTMLVWVEDTPSLPELPAAPGRTHDHTPLAYTPKHLAEKILTSRSALEGERKQVTVLFADVAGFTTLAEQLDPEVVHEIINRCFEGITAEVHRFEGTINQYTGDGVMALFGAPLAHEDSPRRAVHAALGIQRAIQNVAQTLQAERGLSLQMRIGVNTGLVVVGKIGDDLRMDYTAVGDTTNLAARLQQMAQPGSVVISAATHQQVAGFFEMRNLGELEVKGRAPVHAFEVLRPRGRRTRFDVAVERGLTPLVGRERELATLRERFSEVKAGRGQVVGIAGEAGMGKSRLMLEFRRALAQAGEAVTWIEGHCISFGKASPFLPLIEQLRENFQIDEFDGEPEIIAKVEQGMRRMGELEAHIPALRYLLSVDPGDAALAAMEGTARRRQLFAALRALPIRGAQLCPLVLVVEDLHWIDTSSEEFLNFMLDAVAGVPLLLLVTYRIGYTPPFGSRSFYTTLTLRSFSETETLAMAGHILGTAQFPAELQAALMEKAEGVPLFIEEVTRTLLDLGVLRREDGAYNSLLMQRRKALHRAVGEAIEELYQDRLEEHYAELAHHFTQGEVWEKALGYLRQAGAKAAAHSANREAVAYMEQALAALQHLPENRGTLDQAIDLRIDLRQSLYPLGEFERLLGYLREAEALATALGDQHRLGWVSAYMTSYFWLMGNQDRAIECGQRALAVAEARADITLQVEANYRLGQAYWAMADYGRATACFERNVVCLEGDLSRERFGMSGFPSVLSREWLVMILADQGAFAKGTERGDEMIRLADAIDHPFSLSGAYLAVGYLYLRHGDLDKAIAALERSLEVCQVWHIPLVVPWAASGLGAAYALAGRLAEALPLLEQAVEQAASMRFTVGQSLWIAQLSEAYLLAGRMEEAFTQALRALELSRAHQERGHEAWVHRLLGDLHSHRDPPAVEQAEASYQQALALAEELGMRPLLAHCHCGLGTLYARIGQRQLAQAELSAAMELYHTMDMTFWLPQAETTLAQMA